MVSPLDLALALHDREQLQTVKDFLPRFFGKGEKIVHNFYNNEPQSVVDAGNWIQDAISYMKVLAGKAPTPGAGGPESGGHEAFIRDSIVYGTAVMKGDKHVPYPNTLATPSSSAGEGWQPIETAPKDGTPIIISRPTTFESEEGWHVVRWYDDWWQVHCGKFDHPLRGHAPTLWMPVPSKESAK